MSEESAIVDDLDLIYARAAAKWDRIPAGASDRLQGVRGCPLGVLRYLSRPGSLGAPASAGQRHARREAQGLRTRNIPTGTESLRARDVG